MLRFTKADNRFTFIFLPLSSEGEKVLSTVRIVTDSTSDIPEEIRKRLNIAVIPLKVHVAGKTFTDSVTIQPDEFYNLLAESKAMPKTSQPSPVDFVETYRKLNREPGTAIISIHLSSAMSGTYQSAMLAKSMLEEEADITIIDSKSASYGIGIRVVKAAEAAMEGKSKEEILQLLAKIDERFSIFFLVDSLEYLQKGGRIGKASAVLGSLLNIKPILSINEAGEVCSVDKVRGHKKAVSRVIELLKEEREPGETIEFAVAHAVAPEIADEFSALVEQEFNIKSVVRTRVGPVIGAHGGPGTVGIFVIPAL